MMDEAAWKSLERFGIRRANVQLPPEDVLPEVAERMFDTVMQHAMEQRVSEVRFVPQMPMLRLDEATPQNVARRWEQLQREGPEIAVLLRTDPRSVGHQEFFKLPGLLLPYLLRHLKSRGEPIYDEADASRDGGFRYQAPKVLYPDGEPPSCFVRHYISPAELGDQALLFLQHGSAEGGF
jgi:hypothetical protein